MPPIYDYQCQKCGFTFEIKQSINDEPLNKCTDENCDGELKKLISKSDFHLKGKSWAWRLRL